MKINLEILGFKKHDDADYPQLCYSNNVGRYILNAIKTKNGCWLVIWQMSGSGILGKVNLGEFRTHQHLSNFIDTLINGTKNEEGRI